MIFFLFIIKYTSTKYIFFYATLSCRKKVDYLAVMLYLHSRAVAWKTWLRAFVIYFTKKHAVACFLACLKMKHLDTCFAACFIMKRTAACFAGVLRVCFLRKTKPHILHFFLHGFYFNFKFNQSKCHFSRCSSLCLWLHFRVN